MDVVDFIDSPSVREYLTNGKIDIPPSIRAIVVSQSKIQSLETKLSALKEIQSSTPINEFKRGCWSFQSKLSFPEILERYITSREARLEEFQTPEENVTYLVKRSFNEWDMAFKTFGSAMEYLRSDGYLEDDESLPRIMRCELGKGNNGSCLVAEISRKLEISDIHVEDVRGENMDDLTEGYAYVPHPFKRGDIVKRGYGECVDYFVMEGEDDGRFSLGSDLTDMCINGLSWNGKSFSHYHLFYLDGNVELVKDVDSIPESQKMLVAVSQLMKSNGKHLSSFLESFTNGYHKDLVEWSIEDAKNGIGDSGKRNLWLSREDFPELPANVFKVPSGGLRIQRANDIKPNFWDTMLVKFDADGKLTIEGGIGDLSESDIAKLEEALSIKIVNKP